MNKSYKTWLSFKWDLFSFFALCALCISTYSCQDMLSLGQKALLVLESSVFRLLWFIRIYLFINGITPKTSTPMSQLYDQFRQADGFLYIRRIAAWSLRDCEQCNTPHQNERGKYMKILKKWKWHFASEWSQPDVALKKGKGNPVFKYPLLCRFGAENTLGWSLAQAVSTRVAWSRVVFHGFELCGKTW